MFRVIDVFLLGFPNEHPVRFQRVWVDGIVTQSRWQDFIDRLMADFTQCLIFVSLSCVACGTSYVLQSTVTFVVNCLLVIPGVFTIGSPKVRPESSFIVQ